MCPSCPAPPAPAPEVTGLAQAYHQAIYRIETDPPVDLRIGQSTRGLPGVVRAGLPPDGVFLTACNPRSRRLRPAANARRLRALQRAVRALGHPWLPGRGIDPQGLWPDEPSLWIPGLPLAEGCRLARRFGQHALVWCDALGMAHLIWTPSTLPPGVR
jgi:hypothetical protein